MPNETVALHLTKPESSIPGTTLCGLACQHSTWPPGPGMHLVHYHVLQFLVVHWPKEDVARQRLTRCSTVQYVLTLKMSMGKSGPSLHDYIE